MSDTVMENLPGVQFVSRITDSQQRLYVYIASLVHRLDIASDILQETNLVLLRKADQYDPSRDFLPWALAHARKQVQAHLRDLGRSRLLYEPALLDMMAEEAETRVAEVDDRRIALRQCLEELPKHQRDLILRRYQQGQSNQSIGDQIGKPVTAISQKLYRVRQALLECVRLRLSEGRA